MWRRAVPVRRRRLRPRQGNGADVGAHDGARRQGAGGRVVGQVGRMRRPGGPGGIRRVTGGRGGRRRSSSQAVSTAAAGRPAPAARVDRRPSAAPAADSARGPGSAADRDARPPARGENDPGNVLRPSTSARRRDVLLRRRVQQLVDVATVLPPKFTTYKIVCSDTAKPVLQLISTFNNHSV